MKNQLITILFVGCGNKPETIEQYETVVKAILSAGNYSTDLNPYIWSMESESFDFTTSILLDVNGVEECWKILAQLSENFARNTWAKYIYQITSMVTEKETNKKKGKN